MEIKLIVGLVIIVLVLVFVIALLILDVGNLKERCKELNRQNQSIKDDILELSYDVDALKISVDDRKKLELMTDRKRKMTNYLIVHRTDSKTNLADALYDIANGIKERK